MTENKPVLEWHRKAAIDIIEAAMKGDETGWPMSGQTAQIIANAEPSPSAVTIGRTYERPAFGIESDEPDPRIEQLEAAERERDKFRERVEGYLDRLDPKLDKVYADTKEIIRQRDEAYAKQARLRRELQKLADSWPHDGGNECAARTSWLVTQNGPCHRCQVEAILHPKEPACAE